MVLDVKCRSFVKWQFDVFQGESLVADIDLKLLREGAELEIKGEHFTIKRAGLVSGAFTIEAFGRELARAEKPSALFRRFVVEFANRRFVLEAEKALFRRFVVAEEPTDGIGVEIGRIEPVKWYSQSAIAKFDDSLPLAVDIFLITLVLFLWKRSAQSSSS